MEGGLGWFGSPAVDTELCCAPTTPSLDASTFVLLAWGLL